MRPHTVGKPHAIADSPWLAWPMIAVSLIVAIVFVIPFALVKLAIDRLRRP